MLKTLLIQTVSLKRNFHQSIVVYAKQNNNPFMAMPDFGNTNTNPVKHQEMVKDKLPKRNGKVLNVAILGIPNSGKSTLVNKLVGKELCPQSCKHNTTRKKSRAIYTKGDTQLVFLDTPGVVSPKDVKKFKLENSLVKDPEQSCKEAHLLIVLQDMSSRYVREAIDPKILKLLCKYQHRVPSILVLNKMDALPKKRIVYDLIRKLTCNRLEGGVTGDVKISQHDSKWNIEMYLKRLKRRAKYENGDDKTPSVQINSKENLFEQILNTSRLENITDEKADELVKGLLGWPGFRDVFSVSAKKGDGIADLLNYILENAKPGGHRFGSNILQEDDPRLTVVNIVKSKLLDNLHSEVPYKLVPQIEYWQFESNVLHIVVNIDATTRREYNMIKGQYGQTVGLIASQIEAALEDFFDTEVKFKLQITSTQEDTTNVVKPIQNQENKEDIYLV